LFKELAMPAYPPLRPALSLLGAAALLALVGCQQSAEPPADAAGADAEAAAAVPAPAAAPAPADLGGRSLEEILDAQPMDVKARYAWRHPLETLQFFAIEPGMNVVEALPGGGWYSKILSAYLGVDGTLIGADYALDMYPKFGFMTPELLEEKQTWTDDWVAEARTWHPRGSSDFEAFHFGALPGRLAGEADAVLFIRALHNLARFDADGDFLTAALADAYTALKPGGVLGVVQHRAPDDAADAWASGANGYLKESFVIERIEAAGFEFVEASDINLNPADQPGPEDFVWRLPPTLATSDGDAEVAAAFEAIGESSRMTLKFRKPD
jgi:predicted methyltransferase